MTTNLNISPYHDDFDATKGFHQLLFKPSFAVQSRELTQLQSILKDQIAKFGSHIFQHGSVVIPGNSSSDLNVCYVKLKTTPNSVTKLDGKILVGSVSGLRGLIRAGIDATATDPSTLYVSYYNSGLNGERVYVNDETLTLDDTGASFVAASVGATGGASMATINDGVFFVNGVFATVIKQSIVIGKYTSLPSCNVLLKITETIVDSNTDATLLDPAQGSYNYSAPGADRLKITLTLVTLPLGATINDNYVEIMRFSVGVLEEHLRYPKYSELQKSLARRTYDESGDYVVSGLDVSVREHLKSTINNGLYAAPVGDINKMVYTVSPGKAYIKGFDNETLAPYEITVDKARGNHLNTTTTNVVASYGQFIYVTNILNLPDFNARNQLSFYDSSAGGSVIGTATAIAIDYVEPNTTDTNAIFKLFVADVTFNSGKSIVDAGRILFTGGSCVVLEKLFVIVNSDQNFILDEVITSSTRSAKVHKFIRSLGELYIHKHTAALRPVIGDNITSPSTASARIIGNEVLLRNKFDNLLVDLDSKTTFSITNKSNVVDMTYKIYYDTSVTCVGGAGSFSVTGMTIDPKEQGNFIIASAAGIHPLSTATVAANGLSVSFAGISPATATIRIVCAATKIGTNAAPKTKTLATATVTGVAPASLITLDKADGVRLVSVTSSIDGNVTSRYSFDNGITDYAYLRSSIKLVGVIPTGVLSIVYEYFIHNNGSGDYFSVDSYKTSGLNDYFANPVLKYKSKNTGAVYDLRDVLDFRSRVGEDGTFTGVGASVNKMAQVDSRISTSIQNYVGRYDAVVVEKNGRVRPIIGMPSKNPKLPDIPVESIHLSTIYVPPYTYSVNDVKINKQKNAVYTMRDIGRLEQRVANVEEYVTLSQTENAAVSYDIIDATTGLSRFKSGFLIDTFLNPDTISDINSELFGVTYISGKIVPMFEVIEAPLKIVTNQCQVTGNAITLPYTTSVLAQQPLSSRITNINPFSVFSWTGSMNISPDTDTWTDIQRLPTIVNNATETVEIQRPWNWVAPAGALVTMTPAPTPVFTGGGKIICAELYIQGLLNKDIFELDELFGDLLFAIDPLAIKGYHAWANPVVSGMRKSKIFTRFVKFIANPWTKAMAKSMGHGDGSFIGEIMMKVGIPACHFVGKYMSKNK